jgi:hypothetical protein
MTAISNVASIADRAITSTAGARTAIGGIQKLATDGLNAFKSGDHPTSILLFAKAETAASKLADKLPGIATPANTDAYGRLNHATNIVEDAASLLHTLPGHADTGALELERTVGGLNTSLGVASKNLGDADSFMQLQRTSLEHWSS